MKALEILKQPYPLIKRSRGFSSFLGEALLIGLFIWAFLAFFQPFNISHWQNPRKYLFLTGFGAVTSLCLLFTWLIIMPLFPKFFKEENWVVQKEIFLNIFILVLITIGNYLYGGFLFLNGWSFSHFFWSFLAVVTIGVFPISFSVIGKFAYLRNKYSWPQQGVTHPVKPSEKQSIRFLADNEKDAIICDAESLLFIESADNYATIYLQGSDKVDKKIIRSSLSRLETQIAEPSLVRCHRSYIVNLDKVENVRGNAQGFKLYLENSDFVIPVARKYTSVVEALR